MLVGRIPLSKPKKKKGKAKVGVEGRGGITFFLVHTLTNRLIDCSVCNLWTVQIRCVSLRQCNQAGCRRWNSSWTPSPAAATATAACGRWPTAPHLEPAAPGSESEARRRASDRPRREEPQPRRRPLCSSQSSRVVDLREKGGIEEGHLGGKYCALQSNLGLSA